MYCNEREDRNRIELHTHAIMALAIEKALKSFVSFIVIKSGGENFLTVPSKVYTD